MLEKLRHLARLWLRRAVLITTGLLYALLFYSDPLLGAAIALVLAAYVAVAYALSLFDIFFTQGIEGAVKTVVVGDNTFSHQLLFWRGHRQNDPRRPRYDSAQRPWEILPLADSNEWYSLYSIWQPHLRLLEWFGIYWYGFWPFKKIYRYRFHWAEQTTDDTGKVIPWNRHEYTNFIYVKNFAYWIRLDAAEDKDNQPLNLDYLLTIHVNNPYWALFRIHDWLGRTTADANNMGKIHVGSRGFDEVKRESMADGTSMSAFAKDMCSLNENLVTEPEAGGTKASYGVTINGASLVTVSPAGTVSEEIEQALVAKRKAELNADATIATAKGDAEATRVRARGDADAIDTVYNKKKEFGELGIELSRQDTLKQAANSPATNLIWANNPLGGPWFGKTEASAPKS